VVLSVLIFKLGLEGTAQRWHPIVLTVYGLFMSVGQALLGGLAYAI
jgi:hypothetical protein